MWTLTSYSIYERQNLMKKEIAYSTFQADRQMSGNKRNEIAVSPLVKLKPGIVPGINEQTNKQRNKEISYTNVSSRWFKMREQMFRQKRGKLNEKTLATTDFWVLTFARPFFEKKFAGMNFRERPFNYDFAGINFRDRRKNSRNRESFYPRNFLPIKYL